MRQVSRVLSTYTADVSGVCSALYEMGGMVIMHDASGCNSTYNTHDEPRWYDMPSMVYVSGLSELEAVMGDDDKLLRDVERAAKELHPRFVAIAGTPIPMMMGTDFKGIARLLERRLGIPVFGFATNGTHSYVSGVGMALAQAAKDAEFFGDGLPTVFHRGNRQRWRVTMELDHWLVLYGRQKTAKSGEEVNNDTETAKGPCGSADLPQQGGGS